ncbi:shikimate kinase [Thermoproteota archaeon]
MNVAVYGFMGVGKTTIGALLAEKLGYEFIDMDTNIERQEGASISKIFKDHGESHFRKLESKLVMELSEKERVVIACGGGTLAYQKNAEALRRTATLVYLTASIEDVIKRTRNNNSRPLLDVPDPYKAASDLLNKRKSIYEHYADITVDTSDKMPEIVVSEIMEALR